MPVIHNLDIPAESNVPDEHVPLFVEQGWIEGPGPWDRDDFDKPIFPTKADDDEAAASKPTKKTTSKTTEKDAD